MTDPIWTDAEVAALNEYQDSGKYHSYTCPGEDLGCTDGRKLTATTSGWVCQCGKYTQTWALPSHMIGQAEWEGEVAKLTLLADDFRQAILDKMILSLRSKGRRGWDDPSWTIDQIKASLIEHIEKGDPVDIAVYAAFWWNRYLTDYKPG